MFWQNFYHLWAGTRRKSWRLKKSKIRAELTLTLTSPSPHHPPRRRLKTHIARTGWAWGERWLGSPLSSGFQFSPGCAVATLGSAVTSLGSCTHIHKYGMKQLLCVLFVSLNVLNLQRSQLLCRWSRGFETDLGRYGACNSIFIIRSNNSRNTKGAAARF